MKNYLVLVLDHVKGGSRVTDLVVDEAQLPEAIGAILNARTLLGVEVTPLSGSVAARASNRWSAEVRDALREWGEGCRPA